MKHSRRTCTTCRAYQDHTAAKRPLGRWWTKLGTIHLCRNIRWTACGRRRKPGMVWTRDRSCVTCRTCKRAS